MKAKELIYKLQEFDRNCLTQIKFRLGDGSCVHLLVDKIEAYSYKDSQGSECTVITIGSDEDMNNLPESSFEISGKVFKVFPGGKK